MPEPCSGHDDRLPAAETPDTHGAYPRLSDAQIAALAALGQRRSVQPDEVLFREGERDCDFFVVLAGTVAVVEGRGTPEEHVISVHGHGRFLGELSLLTGEGSFYAAVAADAGEVLAVPVDRLRELVACDPALGDLVLRAYLIRRSILIGLGVGLRIVGSRYSPDARRLRDFAARNRLPSRWLDLETDPGVEALLSQHCHPARPHRPGHRNCPPCRRERHRPRWLRPPGTRPPPPGRSSLPRRPWSASHR